MKQSWDLVKDEWVSKTSIAGDTSGVINDDNGSGFSKVDLNRIVKPYFTTKTYGTGLGLAIVNKIINDHEGKINFLTLSSGGARVEIILPKNVN